MKILTEDNYKLMQRVGTNFSLEQIEKVKEISEEAYLEMMKRYNSNYNQTEEKLKLDNVMQQYYNHISETENILPEELHELFNLHDCRLIKLNLSLNSMEMYIDSTNTYTGVSKITFTNVSNYDFNIDLKNAWIVYTELYAENEEYNFQLLIHTEDNIVKEISISSRKITIE